MSRFHPDIHTCVRAILQTSDIIEVDTGQLNCHKGCGPLPAILAFHLRGWFNGYTQQCSTCNTVYIYGTELKEKPK